MTFSVKKKFLVGATIFCGLTLIVYIFLTIYIHTKLQNELREYLLPTTNLQESSIATLRLYHYLIATKHNPHFAIPGTNTTALRESLTAFEKSLEPIISNYSNDQDRKLIAENLYPRIFIASLADTEDARLTFVEQPTHENAEAYHDSLLVTMEQYIKSLEETEAIFRTFKPRKVAFWQGTTDPTYIADVISKVARETKQRITLEEQRFACLQWYKICPPLQLREAKITTFDEQTIGPNLPVPPIIRTHQTIIDRRLQLPIELGLIDYVQWGEAATARKAFIHGTTTTFTSLPLVYLNNSLCTPDGASAYIRFWWSDSRAHNIETIRIQYLNDLYFRTVNSSSDNLVDTLQNLGVQSPFQPTNPSTCIDFGRDYSKVLAVYKVQNTLKNKPLFSGATSQMIFDSRIEWLKEAEKAIVSADEMLSSQLVDAYINNLSTLINSYPENELANLIGRQLVFDAQNIVSTYRSKSAWFEFGVGYFDDENITLRLLTERDKLTPEELFLTRSYLDSLYLFSNETIVSAPVSLLKVKQQFNLSLFGITTYQSKFADMYNPEEMASYILSSDIVVNSLKE